jgi:flagellar biosynthesis regulator FlbT
MTLKITLKPHEKFILGGAVITNGDAKSTFALENDVPILREKDILTLTSADTPCKRIYFAIQLMYVDGKNLRSTIKSTGIWSRMSPKRRRAQSRSSRTSATIS